MSVMLTVTELRELTQRQRPTTQARVLGTLEVLYGCEFERPESRPPTPTPAPLRLLEPHLV
ncbi:MAG: hypothetical protein AB7G13_32995 [Lautropia sp.]